MDKIQDIMEQWSALQSLSDRDREMLSRRFTIDFNYNSNHIEGNTLTYFTNLFVEEVTYNIRFLTERGDNVWWFDGERVNFRSATTSKLLNLMYAYPQERA